MTSCGPASHACQFPQDNIPLHEIEQVGKGEDDIPDLFSILDQDRDGLLTLMELQDGLALYGLAPLETRRLFFDELPEDMPLPLDLTMQFADFKKHLDSPELRRKAKTVLTLKTVEDGFNSGATYHLQLVETLSDVGGGDIDHWVDEIKEAVAVAVENYRMRARWLAFQGWLASLYNDNLVQGFVGILIVGNFVLTATQLQIQPELGRSEPYLTASGALPYPPLPCRYLTVALPYPTLFSELEHQFETGDLVFTLIFTFELVINLTAHWWAPFWAGAVVST